MGFAHRLLYPVLNVAWGVSLGTCAALLAYQAGAWIDRPSTGLLMASGLSIFGAAYLATVGWAAALAVAQPEPPPGPTLLAYEGWRCSAPAICWGAGFAVAGRARWH